MSVTVKNSAIQDLTLTHTNHYLPSYEMTPRFIWVTFYRSIQNFNIPTGKKYNNKGKLKEVCMKLQNIRFVYIKKN